MPETQDWSAPAQSPLVKFDNTFITASEVGQTATLILGGTQYTARMMALAVTAGQGEPGGTSLRDWCTLVVADYLTAAVLFRAAVSPAQPGVLVQYPPGAGPVTTDYRVTVTATSRAGSGQQYLVFDLYYYLV